MSPARPRPVLSAVPLYAPDPTPVELDLSDNVNLWGVPPAAARALRQPLEAHPSVYPHSDPVELREALARYALMSDGEQIHSAMYPGSFLGEAFSEQIQVNIRQHALEVRRERLHRGVRSAPFDGTYTSGIVRRAAVGKIVAVD